MFIYYKYYSFLIKLKINKKKFKNNNIIVMIFIK